MGWNSHQVTCSVYDEESCVLENMSIPEFWDNSKYNENIKYGCAHGISNH